MLMMAAQTALSLYSAFSGGSTAKAKARAETAIAKSQAQQQGVEAALANHLTMLSNKRITGKLDKAKATAQANLMRNRDAGMQQSFIKGIQDAETLGAMQAQMAGTDTGGSTMEAIETAMRLQQALGTQDMKDKHRQADYDGVMAVNGLQTDMLQSMDMTVHQGSRQVVMENRPTNDWAGAIANSGILNLANDAIGAFKSKAPSTGSANLPSSYGMQAPKTGFFSTGSRSQLTLGR